MNILTVLDGLTFASIERPGTMATKSEIRRWIKQGWVFVNGAAVALDDSLRDIASCVIHPKNDKKRVTLL